MVTGGADPNVLLLVPDNDLFPVRLVSPPGAVLGQGFLPGARYAAMGNFTDDARDEMVIGPGGAGPVLMFDSSGRLVSQVFPFGPNYTGGVTVGAGDVNGDGFADLVAGRATGTPGVALITFQNVFERVGGGVALDPASTSGVFVAAGDINGDGRKDIITATGPGRVFSARA